MKPSAWILTMVAVVALGAAIALGLYVRDLKSHMAEESSRLGVALSETEDLRADMRTAENRNGRLSARVRRLKGNVNDLRTRNETLQGRLNGALEDLEIANSVPTVSDCGDIADQGAGVYNVTAEGMSCSEARRVASAWWGAGQVSGFDCIASQIEYELSEVTCNGFAGEAARFEAGA